MRLWISLVMFYVVSISCNKNAKSSGTFAFQCDAPTVNIFFTGYKITDLDSVVLNTYEKDGSFSSLKYQIMYSATKVDSVNVNGVPGLSFGLLPLQLSIWDDYEIIVPATAQTYKISGLTDSATVQYNECDFPGSCYAKLSGNNISGSQFRWVSDVNYLTGYYYLALEK